MSDDGQAVINVLGKDGRERSVTLNIPDPEQRHKLTEPDQLYLGLGFHFWFPRIPAIVGVVLPDSPAERAGLKPGDEIVAIDSTPIRSFSELADYVNARPEQTMELTVRRDVIADVKEALKEKLITQDDEKKAEVDIQKLTDKYIGDIDGQLAAKEKEIMSAP